MPPVLQVTDAGRALTLCETAAILGWLEDRSRDPFLMSVDAAERQITADRTLGELPGALSAVTLYETQGELVDGQGGVVVADAPMLAIRPLRMTTV